MHNTTNLLQNRTKPTQKLQSSNISEHDPNSIHYWNSNNNSNQSTSRQSLKMEIGSKLDKIAGFSTKKLVNATKNQGKGQENSSQQVNKHQDIKNAINDMKNMPNNVPTPQPATIKPLRVIHSKSKNLSIQIQNPAQTSTTTPNNETTQTKNNPQTSQSVNMQRSSSNNSIISELELDQIDAYQFLDPNKAQEKLIIKICDGLYIGGEDSIWDVDTLALNYISHLIRVNQIQNSQQNKPNSAQSKYKQYKQQYVPELITYIHSIPYQYIQCNPTPNLQQTFKKITQFIQHAHQQGQSCLIISRNLQKEYQNNKTKRKRKNSKYNTMNTQQNQVQRQGDWQQKQKSLYQCLYKPAVIVSGYLMYKYSWSMLKTLQFVIARLTAGHKTAQMLLKVSDSSTKKQRSNAISQSSHNNMNSLYSQLITHILPQLPHSQNQKIPTIQNLPIKSLQFLQLSMISDNKTLTYGWNKHKQPIGPEQQYILTGRQFSLSTVKQQQLLLTNTYINCMLGSDVNSSYKGLLQDDLHSKSNTNLRSYSHNNSLANISTNLNNASMQIKNNTINIRRSLKALPPSNNTINRSTNSSKQKQNRHSLQINLKKPIPKPYKNNNNSINRSISIPSQKIGQKKIDQSLNNQSNSRAQNINNTNSAASLNLNIVNRNNSQSSLKNKAIPTKRKQVTWSSTLTTSKQQQSCSSIPNKKISQQKMCQQVQQYAKKLKNAYKISSDPKPAQNISKLHNKSIPQTENNININNIIPNKSLKNNLEELEKKNDYFNCQTKNKIVINVMSMIGNKNNRLSENNTERQQTRLSNLNRKSKLYQSKARLPTIQDILNTNLNTVHNSKTNTVNNSMVNSYVAKKQPQNIQSSNDGLIDVAYICSEGNQQKRKNRISLDDRCMNTEQNQLPKKHIYTEQPFQKEQQEYEQQEEQKDNRSIKNNDRHPQKNKVIAQTINKLKQIKNNRMDNQYQCFKIKNKNISSSTHSITSNTNSNKNRNIYGNIHN